MLFTHHPAPSDRFGKQKQHSCCPGMLPGRVVIAAQSKVEERVSFWTQIKTTTTTEEDAEFLQYYLNKHFNIFISSPCFWETVGDGDGGDGVEQTVECRSAAAMAKTTTDLICCVFGETNSRRVHFTRFRRLRSHRLWRSHRVLLVRQIPCIA